MVNANVHIRNNFPKEIQEAMHTLVSCNFASHYDLRESANNVIYE